MGSSYMETLDGAAEYKGGGFGVTRESTYWVSGSRILRAELNVFGGCFVWG